MSEHDNTQPERSVDKLLEDLEAEKAVKKFVIEKINPNGTLDSAIGTWKILHVKVEDVCR